MQQVQDESQPTIKNSTLFIKYHGSMSNPRAQIGLGLQRFLVEVRGIEPLSIKNHKRGATGVAY